MSRLFPDRLTIMIYNKLLYINVNLAHNEIFHIIVGKDGISQNINIRNGILVSLRSPRVLWE